MRKLETVNAGERCGWCSQVAELNEGACSDGCHLALMRRPASIAGVVLSALLSGFICGATLIGWLLGGIFK